MPLHTSTINHKNKAIQYISIFVIGLVLWMVSGLIWPHTEPQVQKMEKPIAYQANLSIAKLHPKILTISGVVDSRKKIKLISESEGKIEAILVKSGQYVKKGDVLANIESKNKKELYESAKLSMHKAEIEYRSSSSLYAKKLGSESDLARTKANLSAAQAELKRAQIHLENTSILAPFDGYIDEVILNTGDYLFGAAVPNDSNAIGTIISSEDMIIKAEVSDAHINEVKQGERATLKTLNGIVVDGQVSFVSKVMNEASSSFPIEISFINSDFKILCGQAVTLRLILNEKQAHRVPQSALGLDADGTMGIKAIDEAGVVHFYKASIIDEEAGALWLANLPNRLNIIVLGHGYIEQWTKLPINTTQEEQSN